jgi:thiol-disulfide isomerase/thioredoxin
MIGSLESAASPLLVVLAMIAAAYVGDLIALRRGVDVRWKIWAISATGLVAARVGYVWQYHAAYATAPWSILDIRDGGWNAEAGFVVICLHALRTAIRHPAVRRPIRWALLTGTLLWVSGSIALTTIRFEADGESLPALTLATPSGEPVNLSVFQGKPVVLNLWATWCPPCNREMPMLAQAQAAHPELQFVFIDQGESAEKVSSWMAQRGLEMRNVLIDSAMHTGLGLHQRAFPTTYFFDANGRPISLRIGELSLATLTERLARLTPSQR